MRFNKQLIGIAATAVFAVGLVSMDGALAAPPPSTPGITQVEYAQLPSTTTLLVQILTIALGL